MEYIKEQERKFADMGGVRTHHSVYPISRPPVNSSWGNIIKFDNKILLPGKQEVENFMCGPMQIIKVMLSGTAAYYDSSAYRTTLVTYDTLMINTDNESLQSIINNTSENSESELLEIWLTSNQKEKRYQFNSAPQIYGDGHFYTLMLLNPDDGLQNENRLKIGSFDKNMTYKIASNGKPKTNLLFVLNGEVTANGQVLGFRDTAIFSSGKTINLKFEKPTKLFMLEINDRS